MSRRPNRRQARARLREAREKRFERWLYLIAEDLRSEGFEASLRYDDEYLGNQLSLAIVADEHLCELQVHRSEGGGVLLLFAQSKRAADELNEALADRHRGVPRTENARRKFVHRIERMAEHLTKTFDSRAKQFPDRAIGRLRKLLPDASPLVGLERTFRQKQHDSAAVTFTPEAASRRNARAAARTPSRYAARIPGPVGPRAVLHEPASDGFRFGPVLKFALVAALRAPKYEVFLQESTIDLSQFAVVDEITHADFVHAQPAEDEDESMTTESHDSFGSIGDTIVDMADTAMDATSCQADCGGFDLPDLSFCDVPDCGGCDCGF